MPVEQNHSFYQEAKGAKKAQDVSRVPLRT